MNLPKKVQDLRAKIAATKQRIVKLRDGEIPRPLADTTASIDAYIADVQAQAKRSIGIAAEELIFPTNGGVNVIPEIRTMAGVGITVVSMNPTTGMLALLNPKALRALLETAVAERYAAMQAPMTAEQVRAESDELAAELFQLEREEYEAVEACRREGQNIEHRADVDPRVLLQVA